MRLRNLCLLTMAMGLSFGCAKDDDNNAADSTDSLTTGESQTDGASDTRPGDATDTGPGMDGPSTEGPGADTEPTSGNENEPTGTETDGSVDPATPEAQAAASCSSLVQCTPAVYRALYGETGDDLSVCEGVLTRAYREAGVPDPTAVPTGATLVDEAACRQATQSCDPNGGTPLIVRANGLVDQGLGIVEECRFVRGDGAPATTCSASWECAEGLYCQTQGFCEGMCGSVRSAGTECLMNLNEDPCNNEEGQYCLRVYEASGVDFPTHFDPDENPTCTALTEFQDVGEACALQTELQCAAGLFCNADFTCQSFQDAGDPCDVELICNAAEGLQCLPAPSGSGTTCQLPLIAAIGSQCGTVEENGQDVVYTCASSIAFCNDDSECQALLEFGENCGADDGCQPPFVCRAEGGLGTACRLPEPVEPPVCMD